MATNYGNIQNQGANIKLGTNNIVINTYPNLSLNSTINGIVFTSNVTGANRYIHLLTLTLKASWLRVVVDFNLYDLEQISCNANCSMAAYTGGGGTISDVKVARSNIIGGGLNLYLCLTNNINGNVTLELWGYVTSSYITPAIAIDKIICTSPGFLSIVRGNGVWTTTAPTYQKQYSFE